jgi:hypothetical protein
MRTNCRVILRLRGPLRRASIFRVRGKRYHERYHDPLKLD